MFATHYRQICPKTVILKYSKQSDQKFCPKEKGAKTVAKPINDQISSLKLNLKVKNINIKLLLYPQNT
jgi:hypothetical protein